MTMVLRLLSRAVLMSFLCVSMVAHAGWLSSITPVANSLFEQIGGMNTVNQLAAEFLQSSSNDPHLSDLFSGVDTAVMGAQMGNQLCATLGGECAAPLTEKDIKKGTKKLTDEQSSALSANFRTALAGVTQSPLLQQAVDAVVGPEIGGIVGALLAMQQ